MHPDTMKVVGPTVGDHALGPTLDARGVGAGEILEHLFAYSGPLAASVVPASAAGLRRHAPPPSRPIGRLTSAPPTLSRQPPPALPHGAAQRVEALLTAELGLVRHPLSGGTWAYYEGGGVGVVLPWMPMAARAIPRTGSGS